MTYPLFITTALIIFLLFFFIPSIQHLIAQTRGKRQGYATPPRLPSKDPIFGLDIVLQNLQALKNNSRIRQIRSQHSNYGKTFESYPFGRRVISTVDARNMQFVLSTAHEKFGVGPIRERAQGPMTGKGIITSDGGLWKFGREMIRPTFTRAQIADREVFERHVKRFLELLPQDEATVDLQPLFDRLILDASSEFIFGESFGSLLDECPIDSQRFLDAFSYAQKGVGTRVLLGKMSFLNRDRNFRISCDLIREYTERHVDRVLARSERGETDAKEERKYELVYELGKETTDKNVLCSQLLNVFFAGRDTPAVALSNIFFCLARHPGVWKKIRDEVEGLHPGDLTFERLKSLRYLQHAITEALRLYPPVPNNSRACLSSAILPFGGGPDGSSPTFVQRGDTISMNFYTLHRNPEIYGFDAEEFRPERWEILRPNWEYLPFGGGARHCPAQQLALFWVAYTVVRMAEMYKEIRDRDGGEYVENLKLNMENGNGVKVGLVRA